MEETTTTEEGTMQNPLNIVNDPFWQADDLDVFEGWGDPDQDDQDQD